MFEQHSAKETVDSPAIGEDADDVGTLLDFAVEPAATSPGCAEHFGNGCFDALVGIGDNQFHVAQTAAGKAAQEVGPEDFGFGMADRHVEHLAPAVTVDADGDDDADRADAVVPPRALCTSRPSRGRASRLRSGDRERLSKRTSCTINRDIPV